MNELLTVNDEGYDNYGLMSTMGCVATCDFTFQNENHMLRFFVNFYFIYKISVYFIHLYFIYLNIYFVLIIFLKL